MTGLPVCLRLSGFSFFHCNLQRFNKQTHIIIIIVTNPYHPHHHHHHTSLSSCYIVFRILRTTPPRSYSLHPVRSLSTNLATSHQTFMAAEMKTNCAEEWDAPGEDGETWKTQCLDPFILTPNLCATADLARSELEARCSQCPLVELETQACVGTLELRPLCVDAFLQRDLHRCLAQCISEET